MPTLRYFMRSGASLEYKFQCYLNGEAIVFTCKATRVTSELCRLHLTRSEKLKGFIHHKHKQCCRTQNVTVAKINCCEKW